MPPHRGRPDKGTPMKATISVIILTYNERLHIRRCIERVRPVATEIFVVDCHSTDGTQEIARSLGATVVERDWPGNQAEQMRWALAELPLRTDWVLRLDADEYLTDRLREELEVRLDGLSPGVSGVTFRLTRVFMGRRLRFGNPTIRLLRLWRAGKAVCERRAMDEHMQVTEGQIVDFSGDFCDHNLNGLVWWTQKHLDYAQREAAMLSDMTACQAKAGLSANAAAKRRMKGRYACLPLFWRAFAYFLYRYVLRLGFLDGAPGFLWAVLQGYWYRTFVDALLYERHCQAEDRAHAGT